MVSVPSSLLWCHQGTRNRCGAGVQRGAGSGDWKNGGKSPKASGVQVGNDKVLEKSMKRQMLGESF